MLTKARALRADQIVVGAAVVPELGECCLFVGSVELSLGDERDMWFVVVEQLAEVV